MGLRRQGGQCKQAANKKIFTTHRFLIIIVRISSRKKCVGFLNTKSTVDLTAATTTVADPTADAHAANKKYVDDAITTLSDGIVNYSAAAPDTAIVKNNTVTFFPATDLLS